jgi:predicted transcriptional regulator
MPRKAPLTPTEGELAILRTLWANGPSSVRAIHLALAGEEGKETGYSTTLKMVQVMTDKGLLLRDDSVRPQIYRPALKQEETQLQLLDYLITKAFGGSAKRLVLRAAAADRISKSELAEIRKLLEKGGRK